jgi:hypothetical protein
MKKLRVEMEIMTNAMAYKVPERLFQFKVRLPAMGTVMFFNMMSAVETVLFFTVMS